MTLIQNKMQNIHLPTRIKNKIDLIIKNDRDYDFPIYIIDLEKIQENYKIFQEYFPDSPIYFALKSNSDVEILKSLNEINANFEIASIGELNRLLLIGVEPKKIIFSNPCKSLSDLEELYNKGIRYFVFENIEDLKRLTKFAPDSKYVLRVNLYEHNRNYINYGASLNYIKNTLTKDYDLCKKISGLTFYGDHSLGLSVCKRIMADYIKNIKFINLGGGFLYDQLEEELNLGKKVGNFEYFVNKLKKFKEQYKINFIFEPGMILVNNVCHGISKINYRNESNDGSLYYHIDLGPTTGLRNKIKNFYVHPKTKGHKNIKKAFIVDSTCAKNIICEVKNKNVLSEGDILIFPNIGAYSITHISDFHLLKKPKFIYLK